MYKLVVDLNRPTKAIKRSNGEVSPISSKSLALFSNIIYEIPIDFIDIQTGDKIEEIGYNYFIPVLTNDRRFNIISVDSKVKTITVTAVVNGTRITENDVLGIVYPVEAPSND